ncbi:polysaccharide deacetylase family protein [Listeria booriae]|uniref:polysaccharide deacetylase family protein n=1 Tax=Listeria booriae TaxID=1552123 RepID=UPI0028808553|nr:polysaccharide deacetylase family protein [Listeria booriae]MDT0112229.1 polysaccharide deacetylase family protein [Listeria booriae]
MKNGYFVLSLDFELRWGSYSWDTGHTYDRHILGARKAIPDMLRTFEAYQIHATWATVGALFAPSKTMISKTNEKYFDDKSMAHMFQFLKECEEIGENESEDPSHYALSLIEQISATEHQEIGLHTFSHFYCLDNKGVEETFEKDTQAALAMMKAQNIQPTSFVFPRNQFNPAILGTLKAYGMDVVRGNEKHRLYREQEGRERKVHRALRLMDSYINISGHHTFSLDSCKEGDIINVPSSRFLRPYVKQASFLEPLKLHRIKKAMRHASEYGEVFHLWFHPHNFGTNIEANIKMLQEICQYYEDLQNEFGFESVTMQELAEKVRRKEVTT